MRRSALLPLLIAGTLVGQAPRVEHIDPMGGYTQVVTVEDRGIKTVYVSGQVGTGPDFAAHVDSAFAELMRRLHQAGATADDVVKIRAFIKDLDRQRYRLFTAARGRTFRSEHWPASTVAGVDALARDEFLVEVEAVAVVASRDAALDVERLAAANGRSDVVSVRAHGVATIYVSGQVGTGEGLAAQTESAWQQVQQRLRAAGASPGDLVKTTTYVVGIAESHTLSVLGAAYPAVLANSGAKPASTLLGVPALAASRQAVEIDAIAVVGAHGEVVRRFIEPAGSFAQAVAVSAGGPTTVYLAGQMGAADDTLTVQADRAYAGIGRLLAAAGGTNRDLLAISVYIPAYKEEDIAALGPARRRYGFAGENAPASTLLGMRSLASPGARISIEGVGVVRR